MKRFGIFFLILAALSSFLATKPVCGAPPTTRPIDGLRKNTPEVHALVGGKIIVSPGQAIESGVLVIRDGVIEAVGADVQPPADARVWDVSGKTLYPGFIDAYTTVDVDTSVLKKGAPYWNDRVRPQLHVADQYQPDSDATKKLRSQGVVARLAAPGGGIIRGTSALVATSDEPASQSLLKDRVALHLTLYVPRGGSRENYPNSPMGAVALARQAMYDAQWHRQAWGGWRADNSLPQPEQNDALEALQSYPESGRLVIIDARDEQYFLRADRFAREFALNVAMRSFGHDYRRLDAVRKTGRPVIVPLNFPEAPNVGTPEAERNVTLETLMHWDLAPENPARLAEAGVKIALTSQNLKDKDEFLEAVRKAVKRGLPADAALRALTMAPAELFGVQETLGSLEAGKSASLVVASGDLFTDSKAKVQQTWVRGKRHVVVEQPLADIRGTWKIVSADQDPSGESLELTVKITGSEAKPSGSILLGDASAQQANEDQKSKDAEKNEQGEADGAKEGDSTDNGKVKLKHISLRDTQLNLAFESNTLSRDGVTRLSAVVSTADEQAPTWLGFIIWPDGERISIAAERTRPHDESSEEDSDDGDSADEQDEKEEEDEDEDEDKDSIRASFAVNFPLGAFGRSAPPEQPHQVLLKNATIWTCGPQGVLKSASLLITDGRVTAVGNNLAHDPDAFVIDCQGRHITPGIIDCHSHMGTDGGVNESTQAVTAEVRIGDFIDAGDMAVYRQLAGGVTASNILHGSANPIGGQNQVIKLRWGALPEEMKFAEAPPGIKFALGENVKQSNWGDRYTTRYPQSRMGVEQIIMDAFAAARQYQRDWEQWERNRQGLPPRTDLELEALAEILRGERWIHCHSYRQDEILALIRVLDIYGVTIGTFQHVLEGYKVADAMARHGAMGSAFSDWWAYKFEVYDAIPYNGALMHEAGVVVSFNSDDRELARHLNQEAAKAVKYGGVPEEEALKFVTLNPAKQLRIDERVGSLEPGKDADFVLWTGPPLSNFSRVEQTWIDGRKYFDRQEDLALREQAKKMRATLIQKALER